MEQLEGGEVADPVRQLFEYGRSITWVPRTGAAVGNNGQVKRETSTEQNNNGQFLGYCGFCVSCSVIAHFFSSG